MFEAPRKSSADAKSQAEKAQAMYEREIADQAALLLRLGLGEEAALNRIRGRVAWDFELNKTPAHAARIGAIVAGVYARHGSSGAGAPRIP